MDDSGENSSNSHGYLGSGFLDGLLGGWTGGKLNTTQILARRHGVRNPRVMYVGRRVGMGVSYYSKIFFGQRADLLW